MFITRLELRPKRVEKFLTSIFSALFLAEEFYHHIVILEKIEDLQDTFEARNLRAIRELYTSMIKYDFVKEFIASHPNRGLARKSLVKLNIIELYMLADDYPNKKNYTFTLELYKSSDDIFVNTHQMNRFLK